MARGERRLQGRFSRGARSALPADAAGGAGGRGGGPACAPAQRPPDPLVVDPPLGKAGQAL